MRVSAQLLLFAILAAATSATPFAAVPDSLVARDNPAPHDSIVPRVPVAAPQDGQEPRMHEATPSPFARSTDTPPPSPTPLQAAAASLVLPGLGQWWTGHPIRGSILGALELWLYGDALQRNLTSIPKLRSERDLIRSMLDVERARVQDDTTFTARAGVMALQDSLMEASGNAALSTDYVHSEIAWAVGLHVWGAVDAAESAWLRRGGVRPQRSMFQSAWASALVPGLGQILNGRYSKAALLYMAVAGSTVSLHGRQGMVEFWKDQSDQAALDGRSTTFANEQADLFRKRRNQYIWGLGLLYVYQILDATVDARLSRIETTPSLSLAPSWQQGPGLVAALRF
jgi:hypothetical protein